MPKTVRDKNRKMRQDNLRDQLAAGGHIQHVVDISEKLREDSTLESNDIQRLKAAADLKMKLIDKYLPTLKAIEWSGELDINDPARMSDGQIAERITEIRAELASGAGKQEQSQRKFN